MILAALALPFAVVAIVLLIQRLRVPAFLAVMAVVVVYGIATEMTFQSIGKAFGLGFVAALEQTGLLVMAGALVGRLLIKQPLPGPAAAIAGALAGLGGSASGALALLQPAGRAVGLALMLLAVARAGRALAARRRCGLGRACRYRDHGVDRRAGGDRRCCGRLVHCSRAATASPAASRSAGWRSRSRSRC